MHTKRFCRGVSDEKFVLGHSDGPGIIAEVLKRQTRVPGGSEKETGGWKQRLEGCNCWKGHKLRTQESLDLERTSR